MQARERSREACVKFYGVSFRRFVKNAGMRAVIGVFDENAEMYAPERAIFFVVESSLSSNDSAEES